MKKLEALANLFNTKEGVLIVTSIAEIEIFKEELKQTYSTIQASNYGSFNNEKPKTEISFCMDGKNFHFMTVDNFNSLIKEEIEKT